MYYFCCHTIFFHILRTFSLLSDNTLNYAIQKFWNCFFSVIRNTCIYNTINTQVQIFTICDVKVLIRNSHTSKFGCISRSRWHKKNQGHLTTLAIFFAIILIYPIKRKVYLQLVDACFKMMFLSHFFNTDCMENILEYITEQKMLLFVLCL